MIAFSIDHFTSGLIDLKMYALNICDLYNVGREDENIGIYEKLPNFLHTLIHPCTKTLLYFFLKIYCNIL